MSKRKRGITPEDLHRLVFVGQPRISHDGSDILFTRKHVGAKNNYATNLWLVGTAGDEPRRFTSGETDTNGQWSPDDETIAFVRADKELGTAQLYTIARAGGEARQLTHFPEGSIQSFKWSPDGRTLAVTFRATHPDWTKEAEKSRKATHASTPPRITEDAWYRLDGDGYFLDARYSVYIVDATSGEYRKVFDRDDLGQYTFDWSPDSRHLAITANPSKNSLLKKWNANIYIVNAASGKAKTVPDLPRGPKTNVQWSPDGSLLAYAGRAGEESEYSTENLELWVCDPAKGNARSLTAGEDYCMMAVTLSDTSEAAFGATFTWHPDSKRIFAHLGWHGRTHLASVAVRGGKIQFHTKGTYEYGLGTFSHDGKKLSLLRADPTHPPEVGVANMTASAAKVSMLTSFNAALLSELDLAKPKSHWLTTADGTKVQVWTLTPPDSKNKKLPAVLEIHGGPHAQYGSTFFHEFQCLVAAGYLVVYANPRGSKGYGRDHCHAIRGAWGTADWVDMQAVIEFMQNHERINARRMGVMGGSYGGYMTNWIIGHTDVFAGAITDRCVSNLLSMWGSSDYPFMEDKYWQGNAWDRPEAVWKSSPIRIMGNVTTPTLIIHSEGDLRCNVEQGEQVFVLLKSKNVPTRFVRYPASTSHGMSRMGPPDLRLHRLHEILNWWKKWLH